jgi:hypothetical protein
MSNKLFENLDFNLNGEDAIPITPEHEIVITKVSNLIDNTLKNSDFLCDAKCRKNKKEQKLYDDFMKYQENLLDAPSKFEQAEKKYLIFKNGEEEYKKLMDKEYTNELDVQINELNNKYDDEYNKINVMLNNIKSQNISSEHIDNLSNLYSNKLNNLLLETKNEMSNGELYNRESYYLNEKINMWVVINNIIIVILWIFNIIYLYLFLVYKQYTNLIHIIGIIIISSGSILNYYYNYR